MEAEAKSKLRGSQANTMNFQGEKIFIIHFVIMQSFDVHFFFLHLCKQLHLTSSMHWPRKILVINLISEEQVAISTLP